MLALGNTLAPFTCSTSINNNTKKEKIKFCAFQKFLFRWQNFCHRLAYSWRPVGLLPQLNAPHYCATHTHSCVHIYIYNKYSYEAFSMAYLQLQQHFNKCEKLHFSSCCTNRMPKQTHTNHTHTDTHTLAYTVKALGAWSYLVHRSTSVV